MAADGSAKRARERGFTLVEMLVVISIMVLVAALATVAVAPMLKGRSLRSAAQTLQALLYQARSYAATYNTQATLYVGTPNGPLEVYATLADAEAVPRDPRRRVGEKPVYLPPGTSFESNPPVQAATGARHTVVYSPTGSLDVSEMGTGACQIRITDAQGERVKLVEVSFASGLPHITDAQ